MNNEWSMCTSEPTISVSASIQHGTRGTCIEVEATDDHFEIIMEQGSGYGYERIAGDIPFTVIAAMMRARGWIVEPCPPPSNNVDE